METTAEVKNIGLFYLLPAELNTKIFGLLSPQAAVNAMRVSKAWQAMADDNNAWKERIQNGKRGQEFLNEQEITDETSYKGLYRKYHFEIVTLPESKSKIRNQVFENEWRCVQYELEGSEWTFMRHLLDKRGQYLCQFIFGDDFFEKAFKNEETPHPRLADYYDCAESTLEKLIPEDQSCSIGFDSHNRIHYALKFFDEDGTPFMALLGQRDKLNMIVRVFNHSVIYSCFSSQPNIVFLKKLTSEKQAVYDSGSYLSEHHGKQFYLHNPLDYDLEI